MASLQDQLLGAGLINKKKAKRIKAEQHQSAKKSRQENTTVVNEAAELAEKSRREQLQKSQQLNEQKKRETEQKAIIAQIRQIIELNSIKKTKDDDKTTVAYNFTDANKIKTIYVSQQNHDLVSHGNLAIVKLGKEYHLISAKAAKKINERDSSSIILLNDIAEQNKQLSKDDPYADYEVPDDLMW